MAAARRRAGSGHWGSSLLALLLLIGPGACAVHAAQLKVGAGYDYQGGPNGLTWNAPLALVTMTSGGSDATLLISRYHSSDIGWGWSGLGNLGFALASGTGGRVIGFRSIGDGDDRAWRIQVGPTFQHRANRSLFIWGAHFEDNQGARLNQVGAEGGIPIGPELSGLIGGAFGEWDGNVSNAQGVLGITWSRWRALQLVGQMTFGKHIASSATIPGGGGAVGPFGSHGRGHMTQPSTESTGGSEAAAFAGIRILVP